MRRVPMLPEWLAALTCIANIANLCTLLCLIRRIWPHNLHVAVKVHCFCFAPFPFGRAKLICNVDVSIDETLQRMRAGNNPERWHLNFTPQQWWSSTAASHTYFQS